MSNKNAACTTTTISLLKASSTAIRVMLGQDKSSLLVYKLTIITSRAWPDRFAWSWIDGLTRMIFLFLLRDLPTAIFFAKICVRIIGTRLMKPSRNAITMTVLSFVGLLRTSGNT
jgi:hypothetical protein